MTNLSSLQALTTLCCSANSFLGPDQRIKCILEDDSEDSHLVCSCCELFCHLDVEHPVGHLAVEACMAHQKTHGTGTTTLMTMAGFWAVEIQSLITQGVPIPAIITYGDECLEKCLATLETIAVHCTIIANRPEPNQVFKFSDGALQTSVVQSRKPFSNEDSCRTDDTFFDQMTHKHSKNQSSHEFVQGKNLNNSKLFESHSDVVGLCLDQRVDNFEGRLVAGFERTEKETSDLASDHSRIFHLEDQFVEVQFNTPQSHQSSVLRLIETTCTSAAEPVAKVDASPEIDGDGEDDVSWFFERETEFSEYSLEQHRLDCERLSTDFHGGSVLDSLHDSDKVNPDFINTEEFTVGKNSALAMNNGKDKQYGIHNFPKETVSGKPEDEIDDEFDSCFLVEEQNSISKFPMEVASRKPCEVEIDDEFDSCFPVEEQAVVPKLSMEVASGKAVGDEIDDEFDSCFPVEETGAIRKIPKEKTKNRRREHVKFDCSFPLGKTNANGKILKEKTKDSIVFKVEFNQDKINDDVDHSFTAESSFSEQDETFKRVEFDVAKCNKNVSTQEFRNSSAIDKMQSKHDKTASRRKHSVQNNSRHFRSVKTVINQHVSGGQDLTNYHSNASVFKSVEIKENSLLESETVASERQGNLNLTHHQENLTTITPQKFKPDKTLETISSQGSKTQEAIGNLLKVRQQNTAERRLANMQNNSRHFRPSKLTTNHFVLGDTNLISGQDVDSETTSPVSLSPGVTEPMATTSSEKQLVISDGIRNKSRHLLNEESSQALTFSCKEGVRFSTSQQETPNLCGMKEHDILQLGLGLSHGSDVETRLVIEAFQVQQDHQGPANTMRRYDLNRINVCTVAGPATSESHLEAGVLMRIDHHHMPSIAATTAGELPRALIVNGDAKPNFKHMGYKNTLKVTAFSEWTGLSPTEEKSWLGSIVKMLQELNIKLIILKGQADEQLRDHCLSKKIILLENVPYRILLALGEACDAPILTYIGDAMVNDTACGMTMECWESGWVDRARVKSATLQRTIFVRICVEGKLLQTAVLCSPVTSLIKASETRFWNCAHRLKDTLESGRYLHGAGLPEQTVIKILQSMNDITLNSDDHVTLSCYKRIIISAFSEGFLSYLVQVLINMGRLIDLSHAKSLIMSGLKRDRLEPVLAGSMQFGLQPQSLCESGIPVSHGTLDSKQSNSQELDQTGISQSYLDVTESAEACCCESSNSELTHTNSSLPSLGEDPSNSQTKSADQKLDKESDFRKRNLWRLPNDESREIYDSYLAKASSMGRAWSLLKTVIRVDAHIVTGFQESQQQGSTIKMGRSVIL